METTRVNARVKKHRDALRMAGLRPVQIWVPDTPARILQKNAAVNVFSQLSRTQPTHSCNNSWMKLWPMWMAGQNNDTRRSRDHRHIRAILANPDQLW